MPDIFDQVAEPKASGGDIFDQVAVTAKKSPVRVDSGEIPPMRPVAAHGPIPTPEDAPLWGQPNPTIPEAPNAPQVQGEHRISAAKPGVLNWLENLEGDIRHGSDVTLPGKVLRKMGAPGIDTGVPASVGEMVGGPVIGPAKVAHGLGEIAASDGIPFSKENPLNAGRAVRGANEAITGAMQAAAPVAAMNPEFLPSVVPYAVAQPAIQKGAEKLGVSPDTAELIANAAMLLPMVRSAIGGGRGVAEAKSADSPQAAQVAQHVEDFRTILKSVGIDLPENATLGQANAAYRAAMLRVHPDVNPNTAEQASQLNQAWGALRNSGIFPDQAPPEPAQTQGAIRQKLADLWTRITQNVRPATPTVESEAPVVPQEPAAQPPAMGQIAPELPPGAPAEAAAPDTPTSPPATAPAQATQQGSGVESTATPSAPTPSLLHTPEHPQVAPQKPGNMLTVKDAPASAPVNSFKPGFYRRAVGVAAVKGGRVGIAQLQQELGIQANTATRLLEQLKSDGYIAGTSNFKGGAFQPTAPVAPEPTPQTGESVTSVTPSIPEPPPGPHQATASVPQSPYSDAERIPTVDKSGEGQTKIAGVTSEKGAGDKSTQPKSEPAGAAPQFVPSPSPPMPQFKKIVVDGRTISVGRQEAEWRKNRFDQVRDEWRDWYSRLSPKDRALVDAEADAEDRDRARRERDKEKRLAERDREQYEADIETERQKKLADEEYAKEYDAKIAFMDAHQGAVEDLLKQRNVPFVSKGSGGYSRYITATLPDEQDITIRVADHEPPVGIRGRAVGGFNEQTGDRYDPADISIHPGEESLDGLRAILPDTSPAPSEGAGHTPEEIAALKAQIAAMEARAKAKGPLLAKLTKKAEAPATAEGKDATIQKQNEAKKAEEPQSEPEAPKPVEHIKFTNFPRPNTGTPPEPEELVALRQAVMKGQPVPAGTFEKYPELKKYAAPAQIAAAQKQPEPSSELDLPEGWDVTQNGKGFMVWDENHALITSGSPTEEAAVKDAQRKIRMDLPDTEAIAKWREAHGESESPVQQSPVSTEHEHAPEVNAEPTLSAYLLHKIAMGEMPKDNLALKKLVEGFDGKPAEPARMKEAQEALEVAMVQQARHVVEAGEDARATFDNLVKLYEAQPTLNIRTSTSIENQAYSTPAPLAFLADKLAGVDQSTTVYEPTAGNGMLLIGANPVNVIANELDPARVEGLKEQGLRPTQGDALEAKVAPKSVDAVVTNPPFGSVKGEDGKATKVRVDGYKIGQIDHLIAAKSLDAMKDNGRATLILGAQRFTPGGQSEDDRIFLNWLYSHYNVTGHFELDGKLYGRQGAAWPVRVISIGGRQASSAIAPPVGSIPRVGTWSDVYAQFEDAEFNQSVAPEPQESGASAGSDGSLFREPANDSQPVRVDSGRPSPRVDRQGPQAGEGISHGRPGANPQPVRDRNGKPAEGLASADSSVRPDADVARSDKLARGEKPTPQPERTPEPGRAAQQSSAIIPAENVLQVPYKPASAKKDVNVLIPVNMKQPLEQAMLALEDAVGDLDEFVQKELGYDSLDEVHDHFMGLQVDSVAAAIHQIKSGKAVVIADQTGIGKGRQAAAVIRWAVKQGRVPIFMTKDANLYTDMYGDLADIGTHDINPFIVNSGASIKLPDGRLAFTNSPSRHFDTLRQIRDSQKLPHGRNAVFCTYSQINVPNTQQELLRRLAPNGIFILDESHNAGGDSNTGEFLRDVLNEAAGVTYLSATFAKRPDNMPLYFKTDMGNAITDDGSLVSAMKAGGLPLQTVVSNNLVKAGQMFRRERSFDGIAMHTKVDTAHRAQHVKLADATTEALRAIVDADRAFHDTFVSYAQEQARRENKSNKISGGGNQANKTVSHAEFSAVVHNFVRQMLLGIKANTAADEAIAAIERGEKPVVALDNTMGSFLKAYSEDHGLRHGSLLEDFDWRTVLSRALDRSRYIKIKDAQGNETKQYVPVSELDDTTRELYEAAQKLIDKLKIDTPFSPIDWIRHRLEEAGYTVAELTGRDLAVDYSDPENPKLAQVPLQEKRDRVETIRKFNDGRLDSLILNVSGSTGISAHASEKFADQRPRHMIVAQPAQDINVFMQMLGRINRTGQVQLPKYTILNADLPAEKRPTALLSKKMKSLNANTSSNTDSATSVKTVDMLNKYGDQIVGAYLNDNPELAGRLGIHDPIDANGNAEDGLARTATGLLAILPVKVQEEFYSDVEQQYKAYIDYLDATNQNELEPRTFDYDARELRSYELVPASNPDSPFGAAAMYGEYSIKAQKPLTAEEVSKSIDASLDGKTSAEHTRALAAELDEEYKAYRASLAPDSPMASHSVTVANTGRMFLRNHHIGDTLQVEINGDSYSAAITNIRSTHKGSGNPYALSKINVVLATRGPLPNVSLPATQFDRIFVSGLYDKPEAIFRQSSADLRDTAKIITGNLLAAYGELKDMRGTIINFTKQDGTTEQGILLPKKFDLKQNTMGDYRLRNPEHALKFLRKSVNPRIEDMGIASRDGNVRVVNDHGKLYVVTPKAKARGGKYFLDHGITDLTGDFVSKGAQMRAEVPKGKETQVLDQVIRKSALYASPSMAEEARSMAPREAAPKSKASVKMMVTKEDEAQLRQMGYPQVDINKMTPQDVAKALGDETGEGEESGGGTTLHASVFGLDIAAKKVYQLAKRLDAGHDRFIGKVIEGAHLGHAFPEVNAIDPEVGADLRELVAAAQYYRAKAEHIIDKVTSGMTREQEAGFTMLADKQMHDWLAEEHPDEFDKYLSDPRIVKALRDVLPYEEELTEARRALGGNVTEGPHMRWVYEKYVAGINKRKAPGDKERAASPYDKVVTPQMSDRYGRTTTPEYYYEHGLHEFGPSFATRYVSTMLKLAEHKAAKDFLTKATKVSAGDMLPDSIEYNGQTFYRPDVAQLIRRSIPDSPEGKQVAESLGFDQLPKPSDIREYDAYNPAMPGRVQALGDTLAREVEDAIKTGAPDFDHLAGLAHAVKDAGSAGLFLGPKAIVDEFAQGAQHAIPGWLKSVGSVLHPVTGMVRRQVIGLGMGVPHIKNILRRVILHSPGAHLNPVGYINAAKALLSRELKRDAVAGIDTPAFDELLRHAGISDHGIDDYKTYLRSNLEAPAWVRAWRMMKAAGVDWKEFEKNMLAEIKAAERQGGLVGHARAATLAVSGAIETPFRPLNFVGHQIIFGPGGFDQRARLLLYRLIKQAHPRITADEMAHQINMQLGRYNKASWTDLQKDLQAGGFLFFPGWDYSSVEYVLRHPIKPTLPIALLILIANQVIHYFGKNKSKDSTDLRRVHFGKSIISDNLFRERLAAAEMGAPLRFAGSMLHGSSGEQALRDAVLGVPSDARAFVGMANPFLTAPVEAAMGKELWSGQDIVPSSDRKHAWGPEKHWGAFALRKVMPTYSEVMAPEEKETPATFLLRNTGTSVFEQGKPKGAAKRPLFLGGGR